MTALSLLECVDLIAEIHGERPEVRFEPDRPGDLRYFICDIGRAREKLHWEPQILPRAGIERLLGWVKDHQEIFGPEEKR